jgi:hypothetical protein
MRLHAVPRLVRLLPAAAALEKFLAALFLAPATLSATFARLALLILLAARLSVCLRRPRCLRKFSRRSALSSIHRALARSLSRGLQVLPAAATLLATPATPEAARSRPRSLPILSCTLTRSRGSLARACR